MDSFQFHYSWTDFNFRQNFLIAYGPLFISLIRFSLAYRLFSISLFHNCLLTVLISYICYVVTVDTLLLEQWRGHVQVFAFCSTHRVGWVSIFTGGFLPLPLLGSRCLHCGSCCLLKDTHGSCWKPPGSCWETPGLRCSPWKTVGLRCLPLITPGLRCSPWNTVGSRCSPLNTPLACIAHIETHPARLKHSGARVARLKQSWLITLSSSHSQKRQPTWPSSITYVQVW